jgi:hypoxanthine phosphoribosyltransferase
MGQRLVELLDAEQIRAKVRELAEAINRDYRGRDPLLVGVLKGSFVFLADLVRQLDFSPTVDFLRAASYGADTESAGVVEIRKDLEISVYQRDVLVVEDIVDTGLTLQYLLRHLQAGQPASLRTCVLLDKPARRVVQLEPDYVGFAIDDVFVVGYGLDFNEKHRELRSICILNTDERSSMR